MPIGVGFNHLFNFIPTCGEIIQFDLRIFFQMSWFNHQPNQKQSIQISRAYYQIIMAS